MDFRENTIAELSAVTFGRKPIAVVGFDGFIDKIVRPVDKRNGIGTNYVGIDSIASFGSRISAAAGKSTNIELYPIMEKLGGNGPIMANAMIAQGFGMHYIGSLGESAIYPVFDEFANRCESVVSVCDPGFSTCAEFSDGKIIFGVLESLEHMTFEAVTDGCGGVDALVKRIAETDFFAILNWTMLPHMTSMMKALKSEVLTQVAKRGKRELRLFFDLCDPQKRSDQDVLELLEMLKEFCDFGKISLGLNFKESHEISRVLGLDCLASEEGGLKQMAAAIREQLQIETVMIHPTDSAACSTPEGEFWVPGPFCQKPLITTGAGDHCNAGFCTGQVLGLSPTACLTMGVSTSGYYVRTAKSPSRGDLIRFLGEWQSEKI